MKQPVTRHTYGFAVGLDFRRALLLPRGSAGSGFGIGNEARGAYQRAKRRLDGVLRDSYEQPGRPVAGREVPVLVERELYFPRARHWN